VNNRSNEELARLLYHSPAKPAAPPPQRLADARPSSRADRLDDPPWTVPPRRIAGAWPAWEEKTLLDALTRGTKANLGRLPTVEEALLLKEQVEVALRLLRSVELAIQRGDGVYVDAGKIVLTEQGQPATAQAA
jgi:hypothetical protein